MNITELTKEEIELITRRREKIAAEIQKKNRDFLIIEVAAKYKKYLNDSGSGKSYSDFCSATGADYGKLDSIGLKYNHIYEIVCSIIKLVEGE